MIRQLEYESIAFGEQQGSVIACRTDSLTKWKDYLFSTSAWQPTTKFNNRFEALVAVFDLEGFSQLCADSSANSGVGKFILKFVQWLYDQIVDRSVIHTGSSMSALLYRMPVWEKFTGDGVLLVWDMDTSRPEIEKYDHETEITNIIYAMHLICNVYPVFADEMIDEMSLSSIPKRLRCGMARGDIAKVGADLRTDLVGRCINTAATLQKTPNYRFAVERNNISRKSLEAHRNKEFEDAKVEFVDRKFSLNIWGVPSSSAETRRL